MGIICGMVEKYGVGNSTTIRLRLRRETFSTFYEGTLINYYEKTQWKEGVVQKTPIIILSQMIVRK